MTSLIDSIEAAFRFTVQDSGDVIVTTPVVAAIEQYCKTADDYRGSLERIVDDAYAQARRVWGSEWRWQSGDVAERICDGLRDWINQPGAASA